MALSAGVVITETVAMTIYLPNTYTEFHLCNKKGQLQNTMQKEIYKMWARAYELSIVETCALY